MDKHCKGCVFHHNAGHPKDAAAHLLKYNNWCAKAGKHAPDNVGHCKNHNLKDTVPWYKKD